MITMVVSIIIGITLVSLVVLFGVRPLRRALISRPIFNTYKRILPQMSDTERVALEAGTVWWGRRTLSAVILTGNKLLAYPVPTLSA
jgi:acyl-CoA dehydrogenase